MKGVSGTKGSVGGTRLGGFSLVGMEGCILRRDRVGRVFGNGLVKMEIME